MGDEPGGDPLALLLRNLGALNDLAESSGLKSEEAERLSSVAAPGALPAASDAVTEIAEARQAAEKRVQSAEARAAEAQLARQAAEARAAEAERRVAEVEVLKAAATKKKAGVEVELAAAAEDPRWNIAPDEALAELVAGFSVPIDPADVALRARPQPGSSGIGVGFLAELSLAGCSLAPRDAELLSAYLQASTPPALTSLNLADNAVGAPGLRALAQALPSTAIASLDLARNQVCTWFAGDVARLDGLDFSLAGIHALGDALPRCALTALSLRGNELSPAGARVVATALGSAGCCLLSADLGWCSLGAEGVGVIARALPQAHALADLELGGNVGAEDGDAGAWVPVLAEALPRASALRSLGLSANRIGYTRVSSQLAQRQEQYLRGISAGSAAGEAPELAPVVDAGAGAGNENVDALAVLAPAVALSGLTTFRLAGNALDAAGLLPLARALCRGRLTVLDVSHATAPGEERGADDSDRAAGSGAQSAPQSLQLCRLYQGSSTGVALQLLNALAAALPSADTAPSQTVAAAANAPVEPLLHWVCRRGWTDWCARLLSLRHSDLFVLDQEGRSVLEVASSECAQLLQAALVRMDQPPELAVTYSGGLVFRSFDGATELIDEMDARPPTDLADAALAAVSSAGRGQGDGGGRRLKLPVAAGDGREMLEGLGAVTLRAIQAAMVGAVRDELARTSAELRDEVAALAQSCRSVTAQRGAGAGVPVSTPASARQTPLVGRAAEGGAGEQDDGNREAVWEMPSFAGMTTGGNASDGGAVAAEPSSEEPWDTRSWMREVASSEPAAPEPAVAGRNDQIVPAPSTALVEAAPPASTPARDTPRQTQQRGRSAVSDAVEAASVAGGRGVDVAVKEVAKEQQRLADEVRELAIKLDAAIISGQVPEEMAAAVAEAVHGQESVLRMLMLQGEAQYARLALPGEASTVVEQKAGAPSLAAVAQGVKELSSQMRALQDEMLNGRAAAEAEAEARRAERGWKGLFGCCNGRREPAAVALRRNASIQRRAAPAAARTDADMTPGRETRGGRSRSGRGRGSRGRGGRGRAGSGAGSRAPAAEPQPAETHSKASDSSRRALNLTPEPELAELSICCWCLGTRGRHSRSRAQESYAVTDPEPEAPAAQAGSAHESAADESVAEPAGPKGPEPEPEPEREGGAVLPGQAA